MPTSDYSGGEVRLNSGQPVELREGTVVVRKPRPPVPEPPEMHQYQMTVEHRDDRGKPPPEKPTQARASTYDALVAFLKQLERLDYTLTKLERIT